MRDRRANSVVIAVSILSIVAGCGGDGLPRERVSGAVTLDGTPVAKATVSFVPADPSGTATAVEMVVADGTYVSSAAEGPTPGSYQVIISAPVEAGASAKGSRPAPKNKTADSVSGTGADDSPATPALTESIPSRYNSATTLKADVVKGGKNVFDFALTTK